jgi:hypothetical protein
MTNNESINEFLITDEMVNRYYELNLQAKQIDRELANLKKEFHTYFDSTNGINMKGESAIGDYLVQRQIRCSKSYDEVKTVHLLEELNLSDCIQTLKRPDEEKIEAAITLGLLKQSEIDDCIKRKVSPAILVKKI